MSRTPRPVRPLDDDTRAALAAWAQASWRRLYGLASRLTGCQADALDLAQEVCCRLLSGSRAAELADLPIGYHFRALWLIRGQSFRQGRSVRAVSLEALVKRYVNGFRNAHLPMLARPDPPDLLPEFRDLLAALPPAEQQAVGLVLDGLTPAEAAAVTGRTAKAVAKALCRARRRLEAERAGVP